MLSATAGWIQLYAEDNQAAATCTCSAFSLAELVSLPVMVCMDGFVLTHAVEPLEVPDQAAGRRVPAAFEPRQLLDPADPVTIGAMVGPEAFTEVQVPLHAKHMQALDEIPAAGDDFQERFGRVAGGLVVRYRTDGAEVVVVRLGSVPGAVEDVVDRCATKADAMGALAITCTGHSRPTRSARRWQGSAHVIVARAGVRPGAGGVVGRRRPAGPAGRRSTGARRVVAGLGGRPVTSASLRRLSTMACRTPAARAHFLDLTEVVDGSWPGGRRPHAEHPRDRHRRRRIPLVDGR